jgi:hypothetical protein
MIIESFRKGKVKELYKRFAEKGRQLPPGVTYINSWIDEKIETCYQLMESDSVEKLFEWTEHWNDLAGFEIKRVLTSAEVQEKVISLE